MLLCEIFFEKINSPPSWLGCLVILNLQVIYYFHGREVGFTRRFIIIVIITTAPFDIEGREVGYLTVMMSIWYGTLLVFEEAITISIFMVIVSYEFSYDMMLIYFMLNFYVANKYM